jgi:hypothetical protein
MLKMTKIGWENGRRPDRHLLMCIIHREDGKAGVSRAEVTGMFKPNQPQSHSDLGRD